MTLLSKRFEFQNKMYCKFYLVNNKVTIVIVKDNKVVLKFYINSSVLLKGRSFIFLNNSLRYNDYLSTFNLLKNQINKEFYSSYNSFGKLHMIGLGFKNFILADMLYILVGDCNYIVFKIPANLKVFCKKNQIYILSHNNSELFNFMSCLKKVKKSNFYKGKGILQFKNFKFTKLKVGKKQRFM